MYECRVERDSIRGDGKHRLTTFVITFPRIVLAEAVTHRVSSDTWGSDHIWCERTTTPDISKNSASSRAIPFNRMVQKIENDPYMPTWTANQKGMQGAEVVDDFNLQLANTIWLDARNDMVYRAGLLSKLNIHKQDVNRLLEPFAWVTQIVTSSRWDNFFALRCDEAAHPALRRIARMMFLERRKSTPVQLEYGQWHLPFVPMEQQMEFRWEPFSDAFCPDDSAIVGDIPNLIKFSAARCAWVSFENHDKDGSEEAMLNTYKRLMEGTLKHVSPIEHQATPDDDYYKARSNLTGWIQARKLIPMEEVKEYNPSEEEIASWGL